jgi:hypothetical protein
MTELLLDAAGRPRSPATMPGFHAGRPPRNKGMRYPADPPTVEEIVTVTRTAGDGVHGCRLHGVIVVLWRAGLRIHEALALSEADLDHRRGRYLFVGERAGAAATSAWTSGPGSNCSRGRPSASSSRSGRSSVCSTVRRVGARGPVRHGRICAGPPRRRACGGASRHISPGMLMLWRWPARASRWSSSSASSATATSGITSIYLQGIDNAEIIDTVRGRRAPMVSVSASLRL